MTDRIAKCILRLGCSALDAEAITARDIDACEAEVARHQAIWDAAGPDSCCKRQEMDEDGEPRWAMVCEHLLRLWNAKTYRDLALAHAPTDGAYGCSCSNGSGIYWGKVMTANGPQAVALVHYACEGKGYQTKTDKIRNATYWNRYASV